MPFESRYFLKATRSFFLVLPKTFPSTFRCLISVFSALAALLSLFETLSVSELSFEAELPDASEDLLLSLSSSLSFDVPAIPANILDISAAFLEIVSGYDDSVSSSTLAMYPFTPFESARIAAIPIIPIEPAKAVSAVRPFLLIRLENESERAVRKLIEVLVPASDSPIFVLALLFSSSAVTGFLSSRIEPSLSVIILFAYCSASAGLCVTMITSLSLAISCNRFITWIPVSVSSAPVGSSANTISGLFTSALAIATRCIWPPESWLGFLFSCPLSPTLSSASSALVRLSSAPTPVNVIASSTLALTV